MPATPARFGWKPDLPDIRDYVYRVPATAVTLPASVDLRPAMPPVYDQGNLGSCTANAIAAAIQFDRALQKSTPDFVPSRLFVYYNERAIEHTTRYDSGAMLRDGIKAVAKRGVCDETVWPYQVATFAKRPPAPCYRAAKVYSVTRYESIPQDMDAMRARLASGYPFVFGFSVYSSFMSDTVARTGVAPMPQSSETLEGGHAVLAVGYDDASQTVLCRNSWGATWGISGYFTLPYAYITHPRLAADLWAIEGVAA